MDVLRLLLTHDCFYCLILYGFSNGHVYASRYISIGSHLLRNLLKNEFLLNAEFASLRLFLLLFPFFSPQLFYLLSLPVHAMMVENRRSQTIIW